MSDAKLDAYTFSRHVNALKNTHIDLMQTTSCPEKRKHYKGVVEGLRMCEEVVHEYLAIEKHYEKMPIRMEGECRAVGFPNS